MKSGDDLLLLLGLPSDDPAVLDALTQFNIRWPPELDEPQEEGDEPDWYVWRPSSKLGFEFGFQDEAQLRALEPGLRGQSPLVWSQAYFYGSHDGVLPFAGVLPFGLTLSDARATSRAKLTAIAGPPRSHRRDTWELEAFRVVVEHVGKTGQLANLRVVLRLSDWPDLDEPKPTLPGIDEIVGMYGQQWHSPDMRRVFFPLGLDACGPDIATHRYADLRRTRGLELYFFRDPQRSADSPIANKGALFNAVKFFRSRYQDARQWQGELPCGLSFDDAYPDLVAKLGRAPDAGSDGNLSGHAIWHLPAYTLHVLYDNVDNVTLCISLFQPGTYREAR